MILIGFSAVVNQRLGALYCRAWVSGTGECFNLNWIKNARLKEDKKDKTSKGNARYLFVFKRCELAHYMLISAGAWSVCVWAGLDIELFFFFSLLLPPRLNVY